MISVNVARVSVTLTFVRRTAWPRRSHSSWSDRFSFASRALTSSSRASEGDSGGSFAGFDDPAEHAMVEVVAAERRVAVGREHLEHASRQAQDRDVERAAAEVVDGVDAFGRIVEPVGDRRRRRLVQQPQDRQARERRRILGRLALRVVEVRGHGDDRAVDGAAERRLRRARATRAGCRRRSRPATSRRRASRSAPCRARRRSDTESGDRRRGRPARGP